jgi:hypothetical protein
VIVLAATALAGHLLLVFSVLRRAVSGPTLRAVLATHGVLPSWVRAQVIEVVQLAVGIAGVVAIPVLGPPVTRLAGLAGGVVYACFAAYLVVLLRTRGRVACGCFGGSEPVGVPAIARAVLLAAACLGFGAVGGEADLATRLALVPIAAVIAGGLVFAVSLQAER